MSKLIALVCVIPVLWIVWGLLRCLLSAQLLICVWLFLTSWTVALFSPLSMGFSRKEYCSGLSFLSAIILRIYFLRPEILSVQFIVLLRTGILLSSSLLLFLWNFHLHTHWNKTSKNTNHIGELKTVFILGTWNWS